MLEWLLAGHLAGWHHIRACLTSPCFSGVILVGCGSCLLPLTSSQQGLAQPADPFLNSYLAQFAASRQACSEKSLTGVGLICIQNTLGAAQTLLLQPLFHLTLFCTAGMLQRARWHMSPHGSFSVVSLLDYVLASPLCEDTSKPVSE